MRHGPPRSAALAAAVILAGCTAVSSPTPSPTTLPSATGSVAPSATAEPTPSPTPPVQGAQLPTLDCCLGRELDPGGYASPGFVPFWVSVEVGNGWRGMQNPVEHIFTFLQGTNEINHATRYLTLFGVTREESNAFLHDLREVEFLTVADAESVSIGGLEGQRVDAVAALRPDTPGTPGRVGGTLTISPMTALTHPQMFWNTESAEARLRIYVLEATDEHVLLVYVEAPPAEFDAFAAAVEEVLGTIQVAPK
ncbi:MAG: hypothetical protein M3P32_07785 [Chloroflexota bacterium]|nr:hypothetical protein [Chloroflexota bacterium]